MSFAVAPAFSTSFYPPAISPGGMLEADTPPAAEPQSQRAPASVRTVVPVSGAEESAPAAEPAEEPKPEGFPIQYQYWKSQ